jgi:exodeoxyribonuclease V alpha subunit
MNSISQNTIHDTFAAYFKNAILQNAAYWVSKKLEEGHICLDLEDELFSENNNIDKEKLLSLDLVTTDPQKNIQPFVLFNNKLYLQRYFYYETGIIDKIKTLLSGNTGKKYQNELLKKKQFIENIFKDNINEDQRISWQLIASLSAIINDFVIITGGPGTGKTTTITKFLALLFSIDPGISVSIAAPTGKAAARMNESLANVAEKESNIPEDIRNKINKISAGTIHRLLGVNYHNNSFVHNSENRLKQDVIIIDEASMIDVALMAKLFDAIRNDAKLILLGDKNQLASVEAGSIFSDLCNIPDKTNIINTADVDFYNNFIIDEKQKLPYPESNTENLLAGKIIELQHSYRFDLKYDIGKFSSLVIAGITGENQLLYPYEKCWNKVQCVKISEDYNDPVFNDYLKYYEEYASEENIEKAFEKLKKSMILCVVREGTYGFKTYNRLVEKHLESKGLINSDGIFYHKQPVMITSNDYNLGVFNGDIGIIRKDDDTEQMYIYFQDDKEGIRKFPVVNITSFDTVYAMTIHKSQGSEYDNVVVVLPGDENIHILSRELIYTAVTRARKNVLILSKKEVLIQAVKRKINRISGIKERIV